MQVASFLKLGVPSAPALTVCIPWSHWGVLCAHGWGPALSGSPAGWPCLAPCSAAHLPFFWEGLGGVFWVPPQWPGLELPSGLPDGATHLLGVAKPPPPPPQPNASAGERQELAETSKQESPAQDTGQGPGCVTAATCVCGAAPPRAHGRPGSRSPEPRRAAQSGRPPPPPWSQEHSPPHASRAHGRLTAAGELHCVFC